MKKLTIIIFFVSFGFLDSVGQEITKLDYALFSQLLTDNYIKNKEIIERKTFWGKWEKIEVNELVIERKTDFTGLGPSKSLFKNISQETIDNFWERNRKSCEIQEKLSLSIKTTVLDSTEISLLFQESNNWKKFYKEFPSSNGIIELSMIGYNKGQTEALILIGIKSENLVGQGFFLLFELVNDKWVIKQKVISWES